jgi:hypothetical protein
MAPELKDQGIGQRPAGLRLLFGLGVFGGFLLLAVPALATLAAVVLLPAYQRMAATEYQRDCLAADIAAFKEYVAANERLIDRAPQDEDLTRRLAIVQQRLLPRNEVVVMDPNAPPAPPPGVIVPDLKPRPEPPSNMLLRMAAKVRNPGTCRGLFLLAAGAMLAAMFLFSPADEYQEAPKTRQDT